MLSRVIVGVLACLLPLAAACSEVAPAAAGPSTSPDGGGAEVPPAPDPTGWTATGKLAHARSLATTTVLADGRVLVVGGEGATYEMLATVEIYEPEAGTFAEMAPLPEPRDHHTATLLRSGEVLVTGGGQGSEISLPTGEKALASAVLYDPKTDTWRPTGSMHVARAGHRAALLEDGRVLVVGGGNAVGYPCAGSHPDCTVADSIGSAEIYDPDTGEWTTTGALAGPRIAFALNVTPDGVVASGGAAENRGLESVEIYDASSGTWRSGPKLAGQRLYHAAAVVSGKLVVAGGKIANVAPITSVDVLEDGKWRRGATLDQARTGASLVELASGRGLLVAGNDQLGTRYIAEAAIYDVEADTWTSIEPLSTGRYGQAAVVLHDGSVLVVGGRTSKGVTASAERSR